jgi:hypothetical protein
VVRGGLQHEQVAQVLHQVEREAAQVLALVEQALHEAEESGEVALGEPLDGLHHPVGGREAEDLAHGLRRHLGAREREHLLEDRQRVADRPVARAHHRLDRTVLDRVALRGAHRTDVIADVARRHPPEVETLDPGQDRRDDLLRVGGGHREQHVRRRLLDQLEQRVERRRGGHVDLVEDVDLAPRPRRREQGPVAQLAGIVDATVRRHVELDDVDRRAVGDRDAGSARVARDGRRPGLAVDRLGEDASRRGLARPPRAGEQVGVVEAVLLDRVDQRAGHVRLPDDVRERLGAVLAVQRHVRHGRPPSGAPR